MLTELNLSDNLMGKIPFVAISNIKSLKTLDLSNNRIEKIEDPFFSNGGIRLDRFSSVYFHGQEPNVSDTKTSGRLRGP